MFIDNLSPRVMYCSATECDVDLPNEFITVHFRRLADGRLSSHAERWSSDSLLHPSRRARQKAKELAVEALNKKREEARQT